MHHYKLYIGLAATVIGLISYVPYLTGIRNKTVRPSGASWLVWTFLTAIAFGTQLSAGGGIGSLAIGISALVSVIVTTLSFRNARRPFTRLDWICLLAALIALALWLVARNALMSVVIVTMVTLVGYIPTIYKSYSRPTDENNSIYSLGVIKFAVSIAALGNYSLVTTFYPAAMMMANLVLASVIVTRGMHLSARETVARNMLPML